MVESGVELVDGPGPKRVTHLRPVERHPHGAAVLRAVVREILELETSDHVPRIRVEWRVSPAVVGHRSMLVPLDSPAISAMVARYSPSAR